MPATANPDLEYIRSLSICRMVDASSERVVVPPLVVLKFVLFHFDALRVSMDRLISSKRAKATPES